MAARAVGIDASHSTEWGANDRQIVDIWPEPLRFFSSCEATSSLTSPLHCSRGGVHRPSWWIWPCREASTPGGSSLRTHRARSYVVRRYCNATGFRPRAVLWKRRSTTALNRTQLRRSMWPANPLTRQPCGEPQTVLVFGAVSGTCQTSGRSS